MQNKVNQRTNFLYKAQKLANFAKFADEVGKNDDIDKFFELNIALLNQAEASLPKSSSLNSDKDMEKQTLGQKFVLFIHFFKKRKI